MAPDPLRSKIVKTFKLHGLSLRSEGSTYLQSLLREADRSEVDEALSKIIDTLSNLNLPSPVVDRGTLESAVSECNDATQPDASTDKVLHVINAFDVPKFKYHCERRKFLPDGAAPKTLFGGAASKINVCKDRYWLVLQRTQRHSLFTPAVAGAVSQGNKFTLQTVEQVLGQQGTKNHTIVLAMLVQIEEGKFYLEDTSTHMRCDLSKTRFHQGIFTEFSFVLAEGMFDETDSVFKVTGLGLPPTEPASITRNYFGNANFFGGPSPSAVGSVVRLKEMEVEKSNAMFIMISDVWLDQPQVLGKLKTMFTGYSKFPPTAFVFFGNFLSEYNVKDTAQKMKAGFKALSDILALFPILCSDSQFLLIPGPQDLAPAQILPRPSFPDSLVEPLSRRLSSLHLCSNPVRVAYCSQEMVFFRDNLVNKMCRHCIKFPTRDEEVQVHLAKTLLSQGHLSPLPLHVSPIYWSHDSALRLYPIPDVLVCADQYDAYSVSAVDCTVVNPGSFPKSGFSFKVYLPAQRKVENCEISN